MADNKFKNAAAKLLAQHSPKPDEKLIYGTPTSKPKISQVLGAKPESLPVLAEPLGRTKDNDFSISKPIVFQQNKPAGQEAINADLVTALIKYIIVMIAALLGWAFAVFVVPETILSGGLRIAAGLLGGAALGLIINKQL